MLKIEVLGVGNLFTPQMTNTSFLLSPDKNGGKKYLIDCGYNVFQKLVSNDYDIKSIETIFITHTHPDHVGSLGALIYYRWYVFNKKTTIICGKKVLKPLKRYLKSTVSNVEQSKDIRLNQYKVCPYNITNLTLNSISMIDVQHADIPAYGIYFHKEKILFTGDTDLLNTSSLFMTNPNLIFHDCTIDHYLKGVHANINDMIYFYPKILRKKIQLVHHGKNILSKERKVDMEMCYEGHIYNIK